MKDLDKLAREIISVIPEDEFGDRVLHINNESADGAVDALPEGLQAQVEALRGEIQKRVPDDVQWNLIFDRKGTRFGIDYDDGTAGTINPMHYFGKRTRLLAQLDATDWDEFRSEALGSMDIFDELVKDAEDRPVNIPSSEEAAKRWAEKLAATVKEIQSRVPPPMFATIYAREDEGVSAQVYESKDDLEFDMVNALPTGYEVLAVWDGGKELGFPEIETLKREIIEGLGPISRAKAEGRFFA